MYFNADLTFIDLFSPW